MEIQLTECGAVIGFLLVVRFRTRVPVRVRLFRIRTPKSQENNSKFKKNLIHLI